MYFWLARRAKLSRDQIQSARFGRERDGTLVTGATSRVDRKKQRIKEDGWLGAEEGAIPLQKLPFNS